MVYICDFDKFAYHIDVTVEAFMYQAHFSRLKIKTEKMHISEHIFLLFCLFVVFFLFFFMHVADKMFPLC